MLRKVMHLRRFHPCVVPIEPFVVATMNKRGFGSLATAAIEALLGGAVLG